MKTITLRINSLAEIDGGYIVIGDNITRSRAEVFEFENELDGYSELKDTYTATRSKLEKLISKHYGEPVKVVLDPTPQN